VLHTHRRYTILETVSAIKQNSYHISTAGDILTLKDDMAKEGLFKNKRLRGRLWKLIELAAQDLTTHFTTVKYLGMKSCRQAVCNIL